MTKLRSSVPPSSRTSLRGLASTLALAAAAYTAGAPSASAISMRDDVQNVDKTDTTNPYVALGASTAFNAVANLQILTPIAGTNSSSVGSGSGTLVPSSTPGVYTFLTAAHNVDGNATGTINASSSYNLYFGASTGGNQGPNSTVSVTVTSANVHESPQWVNGSAATGSGKGAPTYDMCVITFTLADVTKGAANLPTPLGFSLGNPLGKTGTLVGYGSYGLGNNFVSQGPDGIRRAGNNSIDLVGNNPRLIGGAFVLTVDYDSPRDATQSTLGSAIPLSLEALNAPGDSGGPLLVQDQNGQYGIAGVNFGVQSNSGGRNFEYGGTGIWASVMQPENMAFLMSQGVAVPEPSTYALLALSLTALVVFARRRATVVVN